MTNSMIKDKEGISRCWWCGTDPLYMHYHDTEWGRPVYDDTRLFEKLCLEGFQSGLSWITILRKRENFRAAFDGFDCNKVAAYTETDINRLLQNPGIIRHRGKIESTINNAIAAQQLIAEFGSLSAYFWSYSPLPPEVRLRRPFPPASGGKKTASDVFKGGEKQIPRKKEDIPSQTPASLALSKDLKKRGWKFVGPTTCYAFMQAMGMVNDHLEGCFTRQTD